MTGLNLRGQRENRKDPRYWCLQRAVLTTGGVSCLCVIRNFSRGGAYLAVIGSRRPADRGRVTLAAHGKAFGATVVGKDDEGLHCKFDAPLDHHDFHRFLPEDAAPMVEANPAGPAADRFGRMYAEGWSAGREQVDPAIDCLDATMAVLNPYPTLPERERWNAGFMDGLSFAHRLILQRNRLD